MWMKPLWLNMQVEHLFQSLFLCLIQWPFVLWLCFLPSPSPSLLHPVPWCPESLPQLFPYALSGEQHPFATMTFSVHEMEDPGCVCLEPPSYPGPLYLAENVVNFYKILDNWATPFVLCFFFWDCLYQKTRHCIIVPRVITDVLNCTWHRVDCEQILSNGMTIVNSHRSRSTFTTEVTSQWALSRTAFKWYHLGCFFCRVGYI